MDEKVRKLEEQERNRIKRLENITEQMRVRGKSVHKHNQFSESVFGYLDQLLRVKPNISTFSAEAYVISMTE